MIEGVIIKDLTVFSDERGMFAEIARKADVFFGQISFSKVFQGISKAWHLHKKQTDWGCAVSGDIKYVLYDNRKNSKTYKEITEILMGETSGYRMVQIPPGVAHGYRIINGPAVIVYITSHEYDPLDELRIPHDDPSIGYDWESGSAIK